MKISLNEIAVPSPKEESDLFKFIYSHSEDSKNTLYVLRDWKITRPCEFFLDDELIRVDIILPHQYDAIRINSESLQSQFSLPIKHIAINGKDRNNDWFPLFLYKFFEPRVSIYFTKSILQNSLLENDFLTIKCDLGNFSNKSNKFLIEKEPIISEPSFWKERLVENPNKRIVHIIGKKLDFRVQCGKYFSNVKINILNTISEVIREANCDFKISEVTGEVNCDFRVHKNDNVIEKIENRHIGPWYDFQQINVQLNLKEKLNPNEKLLVSYLSED